VNAAREANGLAKPVAPGGGVRPRRGAPVETVPGNR
jgi:hypothetical protein